MEADRGSVPSDMANADASGRNSVVENGAYDIVLLPNAEKRDKFSQQSEHPADHEIQHRNHKGVRPYT